MRTPNPQNPPLTSILEVLRHNAQRLQVTLHLPWPAETAQCVGRLWVDETRSAHGIRAGTAAIPSLVGIVGGASAGKSTVFNNLLGGRPASRVTAEAHATRGMILAAHESTKAALSELLEQTGTFGSPAFLDAAMDGATTGEPGRVTVVWHRLDAFRDVWLADTPDITSEASRTEGDVTLHWLPWFDRLIVVVDSERWFDRQSVGVLREASDRWGQTRYVLFNRTREEQLSDADQASLTQRAARLAAANSTILEFRRGRGLVQFPPGTFDQLAEFLSQPRADRRPVLFREVGEAARNVLNQNEERLARIAQLRSSLRTVVDRVTPSTWNCMTAMMIESERGQLDVVSRVLRVDGTRRWLTDQWQRVRRAVHAFPMFEASASASMSQNADPTQMDDRFSLAANLAESAMMHATHEVTRITRTSRFWNEIRRWTGLEPMPSAFAWDEAFRERVRSRAAAFDRAMKTWNNRVESECVGVSPFVKGAAGVGLVGMAVVLIAAPGPVTALSLLAAKGAIGHALSHLAAAAGFGAVFGKQLGRLIEVAKEKLIGSAEFAAVKSAAAAFQADLAIAVSGVIDKALVEAESLTLSPDDPLTVALEAVHALAEKGR